MIGQMEYKAEMLRSTSTSMVVPASSSAPALNQLTLC
jgi:hypothetical protein